MRFGMIRILASPSRFECGRISFLAASDSAVSPWHLTIRLDFRMVLLQKRGGAAHLARGIGIVTAESEWRHEGDFWLEIEALDMDRRQRAISRVPRRSDSASLRVRDEVGALAGDSLAQRGKIAHPAGSR